MDKTIIQEDDGGYTVLSTNRHVIGVLEEELQQLGITGVTTSYGVVNSLNVPKNQGDDALALDQENWLQGAIRDRRPCEFPNWETAFVVECLGYDEGAPLDFQQLKRYVCDRQAPQEFYEVFEAEPKGDLKIVNWSMAVTALRR